MDIHVFETNKLGGTWPEQYAVARKNEVYLRIVGNGTEYRLMTATAGEDTGVFLPCRDKERLWQAAGQLASLYSVAEKPDFDCQGRRYIRVFNVLRLPHDTPEDVVEILKQVLGKFFDLYDALATTSDAAEGVVQD